MIPTGPHFPNKINHLQCPTAPNRGTENKRESRGLSNPGSSQFLGPGRQTEDSFSAFVSRVEAWGLDAFTAKTPANFEKHHVTPFRGARAGHFGGLKRWWGSAGKDIQATFDAKIRELWRHHDEGMSSREIAKAVGWKSHASVLYHLGKSRPAPQPCPPWSMATEEAPRRVSSERLDCTNLLQRGREKDEFAVIQEAERVIAKANPPKPEKRPSLYVVRNREWWDKLSPRIDRQALTRNEENNRARLRHWTSGFGRFAFAITLDRGA